MPPLPKILTPALVEMVDELRFASREALLRDIDRAEALAAEIEGSYTYPADWVVFRVTEYRPEMADPPLIGGEALLGDLSAVVERLCHAARLSAADLRGRAEPVDELADRWSVSVKTLGRWRRRGLIARRVYDERNGVRLMVTEAAAEGYAARNPKMLARAGGFSRIDDKTAAKIIDRARRYHDLLGLTPTQCAARLAARFDRSQEAVRLLLIRYDTAARAGKQGNSKPIFDPPRVLSERTQRAIERAWRRGIEPAAMTKRYKRSRAGIHRIITEQRLARLRKLDLGKTAPAAQSLSDAEVEALLGEAPVRSMELLRVPGDVTELLALMRERVVPVGVEERLRSKAEQALRARAARLIAAAGGDFPEAGLIDRAETDLRWAAMLRAALARTQLLLVLETVSSGAGVQFDHVRSQDALPLIEAGLAGLRLGLDAFDPWKSGRLAGTVGLAVARVRLPVLAEESGSARRARVRILTGTPAPDWTLLVSPWVAALRPDGRIRESCEATDGAGRGRIGGEASSVLAARFGLGGQVPMTLAEITSVRGLTIMQAGRLERRAIRAALGRGAQDSGETGPGE